MGLIKLAYLSYPEEDLDKKWIAFTKDRDDNYYVPLNAERNKLDYYNKLNKSLKRGGMLGIGAGVGVGLALSRKAGICKKILKPIIHGAAGGITIGLGNYIYKGKKLDKKVEKNNPHLKTLNEKYAKKQVELENEYSDLYKSMDIKDL